MVDATSIHPSGLVLIVDDDASMRMLLKACIERGGFASVEASDGEAAVAIFNRNKPDAVLLDVVMPGMDGFETCAVLRKQPGGSHVPILMVTGVDDIDSITKAYEVGATDFVTKPINWLILSERVRYMLRASRFNEELRRSRESLEQAQQIALLGSWELDPTRSRFVCSRETQRICGLGGMDSGMDMNDLLSSVHLEDRPVVRRAIEDAMLRGRSSRMDHRLVSRDGVQTVVHHRIQVMDLNADPPYRVSGAIQDISERKRAEQLEIDRNEALQMVIGNNPLEDILAGLIRLVRNQRPSTECVLSLLQEGRLVVGAASELPEIVMESFHEQSLGAEGNPSTLAAHFGDAVAATDLRTGNPFAADFCRKALKHGLHACLSIPIFSGKGQVLGTISMLHREPHAHQGADHQLLEMTGKLAAIAIEQRTLTERLAHLAHHDVLTGLPNRLLASDRLEGALARCNRHRERTALIYIDLDRFKHINDSLGHQTGDILLRQVAERLQGCTRKSDTLARMGGDEFMVILNRVLDFGDVSKAAQRILTSLVTPFAIEGRRLHIGASLGISVFPDHGLDAATLHKCADIAMYSAKNEGGNRFRYYSEEMNALVVERLEIENDLRKALEREEFELFFQPQFNLATKGVDGIEVLLRWDHPERGRIPPARFIPIAEETGLIIPIGSWVLRRACEQNKAWQEAGYPPFRIAVNVSALQVVHPGFVDEIAGILAETGLDPRWLEIEITESVLMKDMDVVAGLLEQVRRLGVSVAIDDFGNGYSSLSYLQRLPVDCLKIDQSFIKEIEQLGDFSTRSRTLIRTFVSLAASLGVRLLAEGIESDGQFRYLNEIGCQVGQGFLLGVPMPAPDIENLCRRGWEPECRETQG